MRGEPKDGKGPGDRETLIEGIILYGPGPRASRRFPSSQERNMVYLYKFGLGNSSKSFQDYFKKISQNQIHTMRVNIYTGSLGSYDSGTARAMYGLDDSGDINIPESIKEKLWDESGNAVYGKIKDNFATEASGVDHYSINGTFNPIANAQWMSARALAVTSNGEAKRMIVQTAVQSTSSFAGGAAGGGFKFKGLVSREGFLFGGVETKAPFDIAIQRAGFIAENKIQPWGLRIGSSKFANRTFNAILPEWNSLTNFTTGTIPKGTTFKFGIVGPQGWRYPGGNIQFNINSTSVIKP